MKRMMDLEKLDEEEIMKAIAISLETAEVEKGKLCSINGELSVRKQLAKGYPSNQTFQPFQLTQKRSWQPGCH